MRSLNDNKINALQAEIVGDTDIICVTESTLPHARVSDLSLLGFHPIMRKDRTGRTGGGVALYAAEFISIKRLYDYELPELEVMWTKKKYRLERTVFF